MHTAASALLPLLLGVLPGPASPWAAEPAAPPPAPLLALVHARLVDGTGAAARPDTTIVIDGERIVAVGAALAVPEGATVVDAGGATVLPGLFDTHGHFFTADGKTQYEAYPVLCLAAGVTTAFAPGEVDPESAVALRERLRRGEEVGARLLTAGPYFEHGQGELPWIQGFASEGEARALIEAWVERIDGVKLLSNVTEAEASAVLEVAHAAGLKVTGHLGSLTADRAIDLGIDRLEHGIYAMSELAPYKVSGAEGWHDKFRRLAALDLGSEAVQRLVEKIVARGVVLSPTTASYEALLPDWEPVHPDWLTFLAPDQRRIVEGARKRRTQMPAAMAEAMRGALAAQLGFLRLVHERGGIVVAGTDPAGKMLTPGFSVHRELKLLCAAGFTPLEAIRAATLDAARALDVADDLGTVQVGKLADLVVVEGQPDQRIEDLARIAWVYQGGRRHDPRELLRQAVGKIR